MSGNEAHRNLSELKEALSRAGLKATQQRLVIYQCLMASENHPTAEEIFEQVRPANPSISLGTVYKTLETLVESQLAQKVPVSENKMRYDARMESHHHIYCTNTGEIIDFQDKELEAIIQAYLEAKQIGNLSVQNFNLQIRGSKMLPGQDVTIK